MGMGMGFGPPGIPPHLAQKVGISADTQKKVRDLSFEANDALINLEADLKRAQLDLERTLTQPQVDEAAVMNKLEVVSRAELAVRKNRMGLMVRIRKAVGPEAWEKLQAEMPGPDRMMMGPPGAGMRREIRIIRNGEGGETVDVQGD
jgi:Spy/CpxP family protein refolding chaperone